MAQTKPLGLRLFLCPFSASHPATLRRRCGAAALLAPAVLLAAASRSWPGRAGVPRQAFISAIAVEHPSRLPGIARLPTNSRADRWRLREARRLRRGRGKTLLVVRVDLLCLIAGGERQRE